MGGISLAHTQEKQQAGVHQQFPLTLTQKQSQCSHLLVPINGNKVLQLQP